MPEFNTPAEIAREVIRQLAVQRIPPTPENFSELYHKVGGTVPKETFPERELKQMVATLPRVTTAQLRAAQRIDSAIMEQSWPAVRSALVRYTAVHAPAPRPPQTVSVAAAPAPKPWRELMAQVMETAVGMLLIDTPELAAEATDLARIMREPDAGGEATFEKRLRDFAYKLQWVAQDQSYIRQALLNLLQLIIENISELVVDDQWMRGQFDAVLQLFARPLDKKMLTELGDRLRDVIYKQGTLKRNLSDAHERLRDLLASFIDRLGELAESTGAYHTKMEQFATRVATAHGADELAGLISEVIQETRVVEGHARRSQDELHSLRTTVDQAHREIARLESELQQASDLMRHDTLTGALNRKGIDEMMTREIARSQRRNTRLCVALLDVDNFKQLNDTYGHATGDDALRHLADVVRETLRPQDSCGRYGGEEFLILLPDTEHEDAVQALTRLQRELTKRFFLHDNQRVLITFSAGVSLFEIGEDPQRTIERADRAMYRAKRAGKNRVEMG
ncbi:MAG: GGDEF domain-containing protein [Rhodocyclaceae bacterium]